MVWLLEEKRVTHHDAVAVYDGVEPVSDGEHRAISELLPDRLLNKLIRPMAESTNVRFEEHHRVTAAPPAGQTHSTTSVDSHLQAGTWGRRWPWPHQ